ncbi:MAG: ACT domain-containing protein [Acidobacteriota bacterium]
MPIATQLNLSLENETGTLARLCRDLAHGAVNVLALSAPEAGHDHGMVRLLVPNLELAARALSKAGYAFAIEEVLFLELKNRPGALAKAVEKLARAHINIRYAYATASSRTRTTAAVIAVAEGDLPRALKLMK